MNRTLFIVATASQLCFGMPSGMTPLKRARLSIQWAAESGLYETFADWAEIMVDLERSVDTAHLEFMEIRPLSAYPDDDREAARQYELKHAVAQKVNKLSNLKRVVMVIPEGVERLEEMANEQREEAWRIFRTMWKDQVVALLAFDILQSSDLEAQDADAGFREVWTQGQDAYTAEVKNHENGHLLPKATVELKGGE